MPVIARHVIVHGCVQGVGFRYFVQRAATRLGIGGSVRNCSDSTVDITAEGDEGKMPEFLAEVSRGPGMARVERMDVVEIPARGGYRSFSIEGW
jgi:acylphosphatase